MLFFRGAYTAAIVIWLLFKSDYLFNDDPSLASLNLQTHLKHTLFSLRQAPCPNVLLYGISLPSSSTVRYLDLTLDHHLTWAQHLCEKRSIFDKQSRNRRCHESYSYVGFNHDLRSRKSLIDLLYLI